MIQSDFARLETDTKAAEAEAQKAYDEFSTESAVNRAANTKDVEHKTTKKTNEESALTSKKADLEGTQKELDAALASGAAGAVSGLGALAVTRFRFST